MHRDKASSDIIKMIYLAQMHRQGSKYFAADHVVFKALDEKKCKYCSYVFPNPAYFIKCVIRHLMEHHKEIFVPEDIQKKYSFKKYECQFCGKMQKGPIDLEVHEARHLKKKNVFCQLCGKGFVESNEVTRHILFMHSDEKPWTCDICGRSFKTKTILKTHTRVHTGETPFQCKNCEKKFKFQATRDNHKCIL